VLSVVKSFLCSFPGFQNKRNKKFTTANTANHGARQQMMVFTDLARWSRLYMAWFLRDMIRHQARNGSNIRRNYRHIRMKLPKQPQKPVIKNRKTDETCRQVGQDMRDHLERKMDEEMSGSSVDR